MSASERLRQIHVAHTEDDLLGKQAAEPIMYRESYDLAAALPELIAVVENAENIFGYIEDKHRSGPSVVKLHAALAALNAKLAE